METRIIECVAFIYHEGAKRDDFIQKNKFRCSVDSSKWGSVVKYGRPFVSKLCHDIRAVFSHVYLQSFLLHDIRAFFCHVYLRFIPRYMTIFLQTRIYMRTKKPRNMRYKQACGVWGHRKSSYKRHRIMPSAKIPFMYDGAEK